MNTEITALQAALPALSARDADFAKSLLSQHARKGLSEKQMHWVRKLAERASQPAPEPIEVGDLSGILALMSTVTLKRPAMLLNVAGETVRISIAGPASQYVGQVMITGAEYNANGRRPWLGRITLAGKFLPAPRLEARNAIMLAAVLRDFAADPAGVAAAYGRATGACCFCSLTLTDERSTAVGYGPICAKNWHLPWGKPLTCEAV
ncbi:MAG TPA: DUF6011 domain-containing protein [Acetobacteraceae bacterium]|jgi:hypothetical protein|nr:DUF6011 domain-containing protein [Acetobacteraceae bacterium]